MTTHNAPRSVLLIGKSRLVLDETVAGLRDLGYQAEATNDFGAIGDRFDAKSDSLLLLDDRLGRGGHAIPVPDRVPPTAAFATVKIDAPIYAFSSAAER